MNSINAIGTYPAGIEGLYDEIRQKAFSAEETPVQENKTFKDVMGEFLAPANDLEIQNSVKTAEFMLGNEDSIHSTMIAGEYADLAVKLTVTVRNKVVDAYNEVMRMQI